MSVYEELLEKLRKNNRMSGWTHIDRLIDEAAEAIEALLQENEQLRAQLESLRCTSCGEIPATIGTDDGQYCEKCAEELDAVEVIDLLSYHNPDDVEVS